MLVTADALVYLNTSWCL